MAIKRDDELEGVMRMQRRLASLAHKDSRRLIEEYAPRPCGVAHFMQLTSDPVDATQVFRVASGLPLCGGRAIDLHNLELKLCAKWP